MNFINKVKTLFSSESNSIDLFFNPGIKRNEYSWTKTLSMTYFKGLGVLNKAIEKRAEKVGEISFYLQKGDEIIRDHEILNSLAKPNPMMTGEQFMALWQKYYDIYGEAYILKIKEGSITKNGKFELYPLNPSKCIPQFDKTTGMFNGVRFDGKPYSKEEVIYDYNPDPEKPNEGISLYRSFVNALGTGIDLEKLLAKIIKSGGKMEGIINFKAPGLTKLQLDEFKKGLLEQMSQAEGYGNFGFIGGDATFQKTSLSMNELGYNELEDRILNKVVIATGVPKVLLGSFDDIKFDNADASIKVFLKETIKPQMRQRCVKLNESVDIIPTEYELKFDDPSPEDVDAKLRINENGSKNYYMTPNEMRANIGLDPIEGGDNILVPFTMTNNNYTEDKKETEVKKKELVHPLSNYEFRRKYFEKRIIMQDKQEDRFYRQLKDYLIEQRNILVEEIGGKKRLSKSLIDSSFIVRNEVNKGLKVFIPILMEYMMNAGSEAKELVGSDYKFNWTSQLEESLNKRAEFFLTSINETTFNKLKTEFVESQELGENRNQLINRIEDSYEEYLGGRAKTIARTEVHSAVNNGTIEGYKQAGMPIKIWVSVMDMNTRDTHAELDGEEKPIDMPFSNGLMFPGDPKGSAGETINCRCQI